MAIRIVTSSIPDLEREKELPGVLICFFMDSWCSTCKNVENILKSNKFDDLRILKINVATEIHKLDSSIDFMQKYSISMIPTVIVFNGGIIIDHIGGLKPKKNYERYSCYLKQESEITIL